MGTLQQVSTSEQEVWPLVRKVGGAILWLEGGSFGLGVRFLVYSLGLSEVTIEVFSLFICVRSYS